METRSSRSKRKTGADTPSSQGEEEPSSESDFFHQLQLQQAEADRKLIAAFVPTGGTSAALTPRKRKVHFQGESESKASHENPTKPMRVSLPPGPMRELTISTGSSYQIQTIRKVVHAPIGSLMPVSMQEQQGPI